MTREEAIRLLEETKRYHLEAVCEAIDMAIEALQTDAEDRLYIKIYADDEPSVKAEKLYQICGETQPEEVTEWLKEYFPIKALPPATPTERTGEWIVTEHYSNEYGFRKWIEIKCPFCGERPTYENLDNMNFCPNCGSMLKGTDDESL